MTDFTRQDVDSLISIAQDAPIPGGARMAVARQELYQRFLKWFEEQKPAAPKTTRKGRQESPASPVGDPAS